MEENKMKAGIYWFKDNNPAISLLYCDQDGWNIVKVSICSGGTLISFLCESRKEMNILNNGRTDCWLREIDGKFVGPIEIPKEIK